MLDVPRSACDERTSLGDCLGSKVVIRWLIAMAACLASVGVAADEAMRESKDERIPLFVHATSYEFQGKIFESIAKLEAAMRDARPSRIAVQPDRDASYSQVEAAFKVIQRIGGIDIGLVGNEEH